MDIGNAEGETASILIREGDDPRALAADFARRHNIASEELKELLAEQIQANVDAVLREEAEATRGSKGMSRREESPDSIDKKEV